MMLSRRGIVLWRFMLENSLLPQSHRNFGASFVNHYPSSGATNTTTTTTALAAPAAPADADETTTTVRLSKLLSHDTINLSISRRQIERLIHNGEVTIAGEVIRTPNLLVNYYDMIHSKTPIIKVQGKAVLFAKINHHNNNGDSNSKQHLQHQQNTTPKVWAVHKVAGELVTENDPHSRASLMDRLRRAGVGRTSKNQQQRQWHLKPIGRLDMPTEGLILVTNDGGYAREMELPSSQIHRVYRVRVHGRLKSNKLDRIRRGFRHEDIWYPPMKVSIEQPRRSRSSTNTWLQVTCTEGKNRQVRNVFFALGVTVTRLIRISYGDYKLDTIPKGMAIPVPYKPVASQKAKGSLHEQRPQRISTTKNSEKASPITWVSSVSTASSFHRNLFSLRKSNRRGFHTVSRDEGTGQLATREVLRDDILSLFPQDNLVYSFGYGSGVFSQTLKNSSKKHKGMLDLILVVDDTFQFHETNLQAVPSHYASWLRWGGPNLITRIQRQFPLRDAHVLFHVVDDPVPMKYGVVDLQDLLRDLNQWESLYLAGRLHKPTLPLLSPPDAFVEAQNQNLHAAVAASLILLMLSPETRHDVDESSSSNSSACSWASLFRSIASLSYTGDFRMQFGGEDPQKLEKLVQSPGQFHRFQTLYRPVLQSFEDAGVLSPTFVTEKEGDDDQAFYDSGIAWNGNDPSTLSYLYNHLPRNIRNQAVLSKEIPNHKDSTVVATNLAEALSGTVAPAARHQSFKGIFTLGFRRSIQYASAKLSKGLFRR